MTATRRLTIVGAAATVLSTFGFLRVFDSPKWFGYAILAAGVVALSGLAARALRAPTWLQPVIELASVFVLMAVLFNRGLTYGGVIPTGEGLRAVVDQTTQGFVDIKALAVPVPNRPGLLALVTGGVGLVAVLVDFCTIGLRRAALSGLPLLALFVVPVVVVHSGLWWAFSAAAAGFLWLQGTENTARVRRWGHLVSATLPTQRAAVGPEASVSSAGPLLAVAGILAAVLIPLGVPGLSDDGNYTGNGMGFGLGFGGGSGNGEQINPIANLRDQLTLTKPYEMLRVRTDDANPQYLRIVTLDVFGKNGWEPRALDTDGSARGNGNHTPPAPTLPGAGTRPVRATVEVVKLRQKFLPIYPSPTNIRATGNWRYDEPSDIVFATQTDTAELTYTFTSARLTFDPTALAASPALAPTDPLITRFGRVSAPRREVTTILDTLLAKASTPYEKVLAIRNSFDPSNGFRYSTSTVSGSSGSDLVDFLQNKQGFCVQYAGAMAYMVRAAGIPARVAVGFNTGTHKHDGKGDYWSLTTADAHAWVEVYFQGIGWIAFDPTPSATPGRSSTDSAYSHAVSPTSQPPGSLSPNVTPPISRDPSLPPGVKRENDLNTPHSSSALTGPPAPKPTPIGLLVVAAIAGVAIAVFLGVRVTSAAVRSVRAESHASPPGDVSPRRLQRRAATVAVAVVLVAVVAFVAQLGIRAGAFGAVVASLAAPVALGLAVAPALTRIVLRRRRLAAAGGTAPRAAATSAWNEMLDTLADLGVALDDTETPRRTVARLAESVGADTRQALMVLGSAEERSRYAATIGDVAGIGDSVREIHRTFRGQASRTQRIRAALLPRSVLRRASVWSSNANESAAVAMSRATRMFVARRPTLE